PHVVPQWPPKSIMGKEGEGMLWSHLRRSFLAAVLKWKGYHSCEARHASSLAPFHQRHHHPYWDCVGGIAGALACPCPCAVVAGARHQLGCAASLSRA